MIHRFSDVPLGSNAQLVTMENWGTEQIHSQRLIPKTHQK